MARRYYECIVCGRKFPEGQGIILSRAGVVVHLHSSRCAAKFLRLLIERLDEGEARRAISELRDELARALEEKRKRVAKVI